MAEMFGKIEGCSGGRGGSMHLFDAARRFYGGNAIVAGGLPVAVGLALAEKMQEPQRRRRLLLRRRCRRRGRVPRVHEPRRAVAAPDPVLLREQPLRDGHRASALGVGDRLVAQGLELRDARVAGRRHGRVAVRDAATRAVDAVRNGGGPTSSSCARIASARTRCTTPSSTARRPRSRSGRSATRSRRSSHTAAIDAGRGRRDRSRRQGGDRRRGRVRRTGHRRAGRGPHRASSRASWAGHDSHDLPRGVPAGAARKR